MIDTIWALLLLIIVSALALSLVVVAVASSITQVIKTRGATAYSLRDQEIEYEKEKRENDLS